MESSAVQQVRLEDLTREFDDLHGLAECQDSELLRIFGYEQADAGLAHTDIALMVPEEPHRYPYSCSPSPIPGFTFPSPFGGYLVEVRIPPRGFLKHAVNPLHLSPEDLFRHTVRTELEYIRNGDCDRLAGAFFQHHPVLMGLYYAFIAKPRAMIAALLR